LPTALITGITGQDGSYLAEHLVDRGYDVYGLVRRSATKNYWRIEHLLDDAITLVEGDLGEQASLDRAVRTTDPDEVYNLAAQSFVGTSFTQPLYTGDVTGLGVVRLLEAVRTHAPDARFYQASTSEMFGATTEDPQDETTRFHPRSPYAVAKLYGHWATVNYREAHDMYAVSGILFNHESPRRGEEFVTRKITLGAARIAEGQQDELRLGNLAARRDWGDARDYVRAMHAMLQQSPDDITDYVVGTGTTHTVRSCARIAFEELGLDYEEYVVVDEEFYRPAEVNVLRADPSRAAEELSWEPTTTFEEMIRDMVRTDRERVRERAQSSAAQHTGAQSRPSTSADAGSPGREDG
jgi:GDPmannose 4,6-dehydratase